MSTATDREFGRDVTFFVIFLAVALVDSLVWRGFTRRHPPGRNGRAMSASSSARAPVVVCCWPSVLARWPG